jgi:signal transduction histidine kinase
MLRTASILDQFSLSYVAADSSAQGQASFTQVDVVIQHVKPGDDPLVGIAALWHVRAQVPVIFLGDGIDDSLRSAAFEAGVAHVGKAEPTPEELIAMLRMATEQSRVGSPELVRAMCRTMCTLSSLVASAKDTSFLNAAVLQVSGLFQAPIVSIMLYDDAEADAVMRVVAQVGLGAAAVFSEPRRDGVADRVAAARVPRIILRSASRSEELEGVERRAEITASMCVPIPSGKGSRPRGVMNVAKTRACTVFTPRDLDICVSVAGLIGDALMMIETREVQAMLQQRLAAVERLSTIGEIAGGIAHEVANPIACVRANVDVMIEYMKDLGPILAQHDQNPEVSAILDDLPAVLCETWEGLSRTEEVVRQMKALVRMNGSGGKEEEPVALGAVVEDTLRLLRPRMRVPVRVDIESHVTVRGSTVGLSQVLVNLLVNAGDACEERRALEELRGVVHEPEVRVAVATEGGNALIHIVDNGAGMSPEVKKRIFMPLFTTKPGERGTGLGLSIVRRVVEEHGGTVQVHSTQGSGTAFVITLPLMDRKSDARPPVDAGNENAPVA